MSRLGVVGAALAGGGVVAAVALASYVAMRGAGETEVVSAADTPAASRVNRAERIASPDVTPAEEPPAIGGSLLDNVAYACPDFHVSTDHCIAALDRRYLDLAPSGFRDGFLEPIVEPDRAMTIRRVFDDPEGKRRAIEDAWNDPVCTAAWPAVGVREEWSGAIRRDLAERCRADAMAEFSVLVELCATGGGYPRIAEGDRERAIERLDAIEDNQVYWEQRTAFEYEHYRKLWLGAKCERTARDTLAPLHEYVSTGDGFTDFLTYLGDVFTLQDRAAWLGQEWAMAQYMKRSDSRNATRSDYVGALREADPLRYHVLEAYRRRGKVEALTHVLAASKLASGQGAEIDSEALFELAGKYSLDELEAADRAARKLLEGS